MIKDYLNWVKTRENDILLIFSLIFVAIIGFSLGRISAISENNREISSSVVQLDDLNTQSQTAALFVGSKTGTTYHLISCSSAKLIKEDNKIFFNTKEDAQKAGYRPAANCPGLN